MIKSLCLILILCLLYACQSDKLAPEESNATTTFITQDTIPELRESVSKKPVASYTSSKGEKLKVQVYETRETFQFLMQMQYKFLDEPDTLRIPNFGIRPKIVIKSGDDKQSCVVGFLDTKGKFREYKMVTVKSGNLQVKVLKRYYTGRYKTVYDDTSSTRK